MSFHSSDFVNLMQFPFSSLIAVCPSHIWTMSPLDRLRSCWRTDRRDHCWAMTGSLA